MRLFHRTRTSRAEALVLSVETDRSEKRCRIEVRPPLASPFDSTLRTRAEIVEGAITYVLFDPDDPAECEIDVKRLHSMGVRDDKRAYLTTEPREPVSLEDARDRLQRLDELNARHAAGHLTRQNYEAERRRILR